MSDKLGVAVIGYGFMGTTHISAWRYIDDCEVKAVVGRNLEKAKEVAKKFGIEAYKDAEEVLRRKDIDIVDVCTPTHTHANYSITSMNAGKHVFLEKPIALSLKDADAIIETAKKNKVKLMVGHVLRFFPEYMNAKELIDQGMIGEPVIARTFRGGPIPEWSPWFLDKKQSGGVAIDLAIHDIDYLMWVFNKRVERVYAIINRLVHKDISAEDFALINLRFEDGGTALVEANWALPKMHPFTMKFEVDGTKGMITLDNQSPVPVKLITNESISGFSPETLPWRPAVHPFPVDPFYRELKHFVECIKEDRTPMTDGVVARRSLEVCIAALKSSELNTPIYLPIKEG
ncbi:MAG: Gfo/Idh/MocA family oxidoreductase [Nitrososphaerota archaeon]